jgi:hypothetical protein
VKKVFGVFFKKEALPFATLGFSFALPPPAIARQYGSHNQLA